MKWRTGLTVRIIFMSEFNARNSLIAPPSASTASSTEILRRRNKSGLCLWQLATTLPVSFSSYTHAVPKVTTSVVTFDKSTDSIDELMASRHSCLSAREKREWCIQLW